MFPLKIKNSKIPPGEIAFSDAFIRSRDNATSASSKVGELHRRTLLFPRMVRFSGNGETAGGRGTSLLFSETIPLRSRSPIALFNREMEEGV